MPPWKAPSDLPQLQLFFRQIDPVTLCQNRNDILKFLFVRRTEINPDAKTIYQGKLLLHGIGRMQIVLRP